MNGVCFLDTRHRISNVFSLPVARAESVLVEILSQSVTGTEFYGITTTSGTAVPTERLIANTYSVKLQDRIRKRWPSKVQRAKELELIYPDPIIAIVNLLQDLPGDYDAWREIVDEPYG
ncbi:MAG: hypothetical protein P4L50_23700 [Anaerolineaceae bacterium]|nr:hypothetical protein [Anaerolineaceae bacterium]